MMSKKNRCLLLLLMDTDISYNVPSIYDVATKDSNVQKGKGGARSVYALLCDSQLFDVFFGTLDSLLYII